MNSAAELAALPTVLTAVFLVSGAAITLIGSLGLLRLHSFYERVHAPTLGTTLGTTFIAIASMIYFSALGKRPVLHELLIIFLVVTTTPIGLMILVNAALVRDKFESDGASRRKARDEHPDVL
ncbi:Na+/H+ antiporter subunit [Nitrobacter sp. Nb-311A]|uniref:monovalent cation/H(+) antiporter subunit G n=1 Tax=unclassified Nitrobacter TaxID=2620411 RepID=UPI000068602F|nr:MULTISPECIES: monovalent cation/H(+) antiporter subunit G [unclassified Nitrobacter]EAQ36632.1 Na+/H+ antiporter subunit [Nitrobacter sp. Nb-311A]MCB1393164.1 cation:proton antiporter [Nitrobacter sp.]MCV0386007.1 monovalent cation/H(+) antiporter subunit G [Nitrobacter sp.]